MPIAHKKAATIGGTQPNLVPGNLAIDMVDRFLWLRARGRAFAVSLDKWLNRTAPAEGIDGAPLVTDPAGPYWDGDQVPASVVDGEIKVDQSPPSNAFNVPGCSILSQGAGQAFAANSVVVEDFYVASDQITLDRIGFKLLSTLAPGAIRLAVTDGDNNMMGQTTIANPIDASVNSVSLGITLPRGHYRTVLWCAAGVTLQDINVARREQGWNLSGQDAAFIRRRTATSDMSAGIDISALPLTDQTDDQPGESKVTLLRWTTP